jgi:hypothetical protein
MYKNKGRTKNVRSNGRRKIETERGGMTNEIHGKRNRKKVRSKERQCKKKIHDGIVPWEVMLWKAAVIMN